MRPDDSGAAAPQPGHSIALAGDPEAEDLLDTLNRVGTALAAELDLERLVETIIFATMRLTGAAYGALFERVPPERDGGAEAWRLSSLSGAPREAFTRFGLPRPTALFGPIFRAEGVVRSDDVLADPRYGSLGGMPPGHLPVRSYLGVPVVARSGETLGALLFGHPEPGRFGGREERLITGLAGQAAVALDNARLFRAVQREQDRFRAAVQAVRGVLWTNDAEGRMVGEQPGWAALTGQAFEEYQEYGWADAVHPEDAQPTVDAWNRAVAERRTFVFEHRVRRCDGAWRTFAIRAVPVLEPEGGGIREWVGVHTDITEQREAEAELRESNAELQRYAYIVSHDLRSPLVNVAGFTNELESLRNVLLEAGAEPPGSPLRERAVREFNEATGFIKAAVAKMDGLIGAILKLAREGRRTFRPEPLDMDALVQGLVDSQRHQLDAAGATIAIGHLPGIVADRLAIEQAFGNLLENAVKYLDPARPGQIRIEGEALGRAWVVYRVADNGRGIGREDHARVFELFRRAGAQDRPGEGIGLAHVKTVLRSLGGRIALTSELGLGTTFTVTLPRSPPSRG